MSLRPVLTSLAGVFKLLFFYCEWHQVKATKFFGGGLFLVSKSDSMAIWQGGWEQRGMALEQ